jgi:MerR family mercuric resistance operon transcriptional regulator
VDVARVQAICRAKRLGFTLREIGELLPILSESRPRCPSLVRHAAGKIAEITRKIGELEEARSALERLVAGCTWETGSKSGCQSISTLKLKED